MSTMIPAWVDGVLTPVEKLAVHRAGLRHKAVSVFLIHDRTILMQRRALGKYHTPGLWANTCCTHPDWGETPLACARRRLAQELGITGVEPEYRQTLEYRAEVGGGMIEHEVVDVFVAEVQTDIHFAPNPDEVMETMWIHYDALCLDVAYEPGRYTPWLCIYLRDHADAIFGSDWMIE